HVMGTTENYFLTTPEFGTTYYFAIRSSDTAGNLSPIDVRAATTGQQAHAIPADLPPPAVTNFIGIPGDGQITLFWTPVSASDFWRYELYRSSVSASTSTLTLVTTI